MIFCHFTYARFIIKPKSVATAKGLVDGISAAITYDILALFGIFVLFFVTVNFKLSQMQHYFYDGVPTFMFEIMVQIYIKNQMVKYMKVLGQQ